MQKNYKYWLLKKRTQTVHGKTYMLDGSALWYHKGHDWIKKNHPEYKT